MTAVGAGLDVNSGRGLCKPRNQKWRWNQINPEISRHQRRCDRTVRHMAMGKRTSEQAPMCVAATAFPVLPGHPFYAKLNKDSLAVRTFAGRDPDTAAPDHSTISRTRRLIDVETLHRGATGHLSALYRGGRRPTGLVGADRGAGGSAENGVPSTGPL